MTLTVRRCCPNSAAQATGSHNRRLARRHAQCAVDADRLSVEHPVLDDVAGKLRVLGGGAEALGEGDARAELLARTVL